MKIFPIKSAMAFSMLAIICLSALAIEPPYRDDFIADKQDGRRAMRGTWVFDHGSATCTQDDELYKKFKDHGPVVWQDVDFIDATVRFSMKADSEVQSFVFTINGADGHVFRFVSRPAPKKTLIKAFQREGEPDGILVRDAPPLAVGKWTEVVVTFRGEVAMVKIGDYEKALSHPAIAQAKTTVGLGFGFGTMSFKDFSVE